MSVAEKSIEISNVGPIDHLRIDCPPDGGVIVFHGGPGAGKSHAIQSVAALTDANARKSLRASDGFPSGKIEGLGVSVRLGRSNTSRGELELHSLESGVDPSLLVDPGLKDPLAADSKRLATLVRLAGIKISADKWSESVGSYAEEIALKDLVSDDPVQTADKVRRRLHDRALTTERIKDSKGAEGLALLKSIADVDLNASQGNPAVELNEVHGDLARLNEQRAAYTKTMAAIEFSRAELLKAQSISLDINDLHAEIKRYAKESDEAEKKKLELDADIIRLRAEIEELEDESSSYGTQAQIAKSRLESANQRLGDAEFHLSEIDRLVRTVNSVVPENPTAEQFAAVEDRRIAAIESLSQERIVSRALATKHTAEGLLLEAESLASAAESMRAIARSTDQVLEQSLIDAGFDSVKVHDGRLCVKSDRGLEPVSELSTGERWRLALDLAARGLPKDSILTVQQEGWQSLGDQLKQEVATMARERGLLIVTAQVDSGELRSEVL